MRSIIFALSFMPTLSMPAIADPALSGRTFYAAPAGQPFCRDIADLPRYIGGVMRKSDEADSIPGCYMIKPGVEVVVTEDIASGSNLMHVVRLRVLGVPPHQAIGYSISLGLRTHR